MFEFFEEILFAGNLDWFNFLIDDIEELVIDENSLINIVSHVGEDLMANRRSDSEIHWCLDSTSNLSD